MLKQFRLVFFSALWIGSVCQSFAQTSEEGTGSLLLVNGRILTMIGDDVLMGNVLMDRGRITAVGDEAVEIPPSTEIIDLGGRMVIPGLIDSHVHFVRAGLRPGHDM
ncbi:MAG: amidohydrolase family protein, partial [Pseudomonadota bacterium]|nr:amidohydrolase family protein [Pseudomonadota bacterium]